MKIALICFAVSVATFAVATILSKIGKRWSRLPHFFCNYVGGVWAVCSVSDYKEALLRGSIRERTSGKEPLVVVPETLAFSNNTYPGGDKFSGCLTLQDNRVREAGSLYPNEAAPQLFVPFASEHFMNFERQARIFKPEDPAAFEQRKRRENRERNFRLRFTHWEWREPLMLGGIKVASGLAMFIILAGTIAVWLGESDRAYEQKPAVVHLTTPNSQVVQKIDTTREGRHDLLMYEDIGSNSIIKGRVSKLLALGGGISQVCVQRPNEQLRCGLGNGEVKIGDTVYLRTGELLRWANKDWHPNHETGSWVITQAEAEALASTGKFQIIE